MNIPPSLHKKPFPPLSSNENSWNSFFSQFNIEPSDEERKEMTRHFTQELTRMIQHHMHKMIEAYKKMREEKN